MSESIHRLAFVGSLCAFAVCPRAAIAREPLSLDYLDAVPGAIGVYAKTMGDDPPIATYRDGEPFPTASTIKVVIMLAAFRAIAAGTLRMSTPIPIERADMVAGSPVYGYARAGRAYPLQEMLRAMIRQSDNSASNAMISALGFGAINAAAAAAGMKSTRLRRHFLDYKAIVAHNENISTPRDMAALLFAIERGSREGIETVASPASCRAMIAILLGQEDRDKIARGLPRGTTIANKTGEITGVRSDVAIVEPFGDTPYVLAIMTKELRHYGAGIAAVHRVARDVHRAINA